jgi:F0F1-type ATP synthase, epsilon subunit (mitochondrial delta subunit)
MNDSLNLSIVSPEEAVFQGEVSRITLPGSMGAFTILPRHAAIVSSLKAGKLTYVTNGIEETVNIHNGFVEKSGEDVSVCITIDNNGDK